MRYTHSRKSALISASQSYIQTPAPRCETTDTGWCTVYHAICHFTLPAFAGYSSNPWA